MEFKFSINNLFGSEINKLDRSLMPFRTCATSIREYKAQLCEVINKMGEASAKAQGLGTVITTAHRMQLSDHQLYIMIDSEAHSGKGSVVGLIKMGQKRLFVYDHHGNQHEMEPLCTLDFYVHESKQRMGYGRKLFDFMVKEQGLKPHQIAIDRPSPKFLSFLQKHFHLKATVPQVNNFVIFDGFFRDKPANAILDRRRFGKPPLHPYHRQGSQGGNRETNVERVSRLSGRHPSADNVSSARSNLSSRENETAALNRIPFHRQDSLDTISVDSRPGSHRSAMGDSDQVNSRNMGAQNAKYSRHGGNAPTPPPPVPPSPMATDGNHNTVLKLDVSNRNIRGKDPPLLRREGPPTTYKQLIGNHSNSRVNVDDYQDRRGHLRVAPREAAAPQNRQGQSAPVKETSSYPQLTKPQTTSPPGLPYPMSQNTHQETSWKIFGVPPNPRNTAKSSFPHHQHQTRLW